MADRGRQFFLLVMIAGILLVLIRLGTPPLIDPDEARFARTSVEMTRSGDPVIPTFEGQPRLVKPPLLHWLQATLFRYCGASELAARLPSALATLCSMLLVGWIARRRFGDEGGAWAAAIFITQPLVLALGRLGTTDALLALHILAVVALDIAEPDETGSQKNAAIGALLGLAFLAKGPVGIVLPLLVILAGRTAAGRPIMPHWKTVLTVIGTWAVVALPWGLAFIHRQTAGTVWRTFREEVWHRYSAGDAHHAEPVWYFGVILLVGAAPWVATLPVSLVRVLRERHSPAARTALYAAAGLLMGLMVLSFGSGKLPQYILPLMPLVALLATWELGQQLGEARERLLAMAIMGGALFAMMFAFGVLAVARDEPAIRITAVIGSVAYGLAGLTGTLGLVRRSVRQVWGAAAVASMVTLLAATLVAHPFLGSYRSSRMLIERVPALASERPVVLVEINIPSMTYYLDRVPERISGAEVEQRLSRGDDPVLVFAEVDLQQLPAGVRGRLRRIGSFGKLRALEQTGAMPGASAGPA